MRRSTEFVRVAGALAGVMLGGMAWAATDAERIDALEKQVSQLEAKGPTRGDEGLPLHGFLDVGAAYRSNGGPRGFGVGNLDFYLTPRIGDRIKGLVELTFEVDSVTGELETDLERAQFGNVLGAT